VAEFVDERTPPPYRHCADRTLCAASDLLSTQFSSANERRPLRIVGAIAAEVVVPDDWMLRLR
jgi:hypothetical protein